ncbi:hypothetical protein AB0O01_34455 [Streptomyces sp. NPDC093252]|uniref:hypothetical protein n=1 Tax=Streptomyces sp. NPDC093252 TaxID=3154980 RepID=UPI00344994CC
MNSEAAPRPRPALGWTPATVASPGGPLLICAADAFAAWTGAAHDAAYDLDPGGDYARAWSAVHPDDDDLEAAIVDFGEHGQHRGVIWEMEGEGTAEIAQTTRTAHRREAPGADSFLITRSWIPRGSTPAPRHRAAGASPAEERGTGELHLPGGRVVVAWAGLDADGTGSYADARERAESIAALARLNPPVALHREDQAGLGTILRVTPGTYRVTHGWHEGTRGRYMPSEEAQGPVRKQYEDDDWSCRWIRFTRVTGRDR